MKNIILIVLSLLMLISVDVQAQGTLVPPKVDKRIELLGIVFRLAGNKEYNNSTFKLYTDRIDSHFAPYKDHELIKLARSLRENNGVSYDAVMSMAINIDDNFDLPKNYNELEQRWDRTKVEQFGKLLKEFVKDSNFEQFYNSNKDLYEEAVKRFMPIYDHVNIKWYTDFYGYQAKDIFRIILSMSNGDGNYGIAVTDKQNVRNSYSIIGTWTPDSEGMIVYPTSYVFPVLIHEFNHSFIKFDVDMFRVSGEQIFSVVGKQMASQAYTHWSIVLEEAIVRAAVIKYMKDNGFEDGIPNEISKQKMRGFVWVEKLYNELEKYDADRKVYPTLESYVPNLIEAYSDFAKYTQNYDNLRPKVVSIDEFNNGDASVSCEIKTITVNFDRPLAGIGYSFNYGRFGEQGMPKIVKFDYKNNNRTIVITTELQPEKEYAITLLGLSFKTPEQDGMKSYEIYFKTK